MKTTRLSLALALLAPLALGACVSSQSREDAPPPNMPQSLAEESDDAGGQLNSLISRYAAEYDVPVSLVHRVVKRESNYNPAARNGPYYGLMQILPQTARTMGFRGTPNDLLDAETNLTYAVKYLRGAWLVSDGSEAQAVKWYSRGYYYEAKRRGLLVETGLKAG